MKIASTLMLLLVSAAAVSITPRMAAAETAPPSAPTAAKIVERVIEADTWGLGGAEASAKATVTSKSGSSRALAFEVKSRLHAPPLGKSLITFQAPADLAGMKFLQIQNGASDDERFLYTPELKRSRRIAATNRAESFMGTDFSYADLDARDLRQSASVLLPEERIGKYDCYRVAVTPQNADAVYSKIELSVRKDNSVPLKWVMFDKKSGANPAKTLLVKEIQRHGDHWFVTSSRMTDHATGRTTEIALGKITRRQDIPLETFSVRAIEKN
jgi:hypothetical protein